MATRLFDLNKTVLSFRNNVEKFLMGLTTNTLDKPKNAFVNQHGRIITTFDQVKVGEDEYFALIEAPFVQSLRDHIDRHARLNKTIVEELNYGVFFDLENTYRVDRDEFFVPQRKGKIVISRPSLPNEKNLYSVSLEEFTLFRLENNIPVMGLDYQPNEFILNVDEEDFVSFTKGCFLGQEPIAKVHNRSRPTRKLVVRYADELTTVEKATMTSKATEPQTGRVKGFVFASNRE